MSTLKKSRFDEHRVLPSLLIAPQILITVLFFLYPAFEAIRQSFFLSDPFGQYSAWIGLQNFRDLFSSEDFFRTFVRSLGLGLSTALLSMALGLGLAVLVLRLHRGRQLAQNLMLFPYALSPLIAGVLWLFILHPTFGAIGYGLRRLGVDWNPVLRGSDAFWLVVAASSWKQVSYNFVFFLSALHGVPQSLLEAASIDGAGPFKRFFRVTFPMLAPTTFFLATMNLVYAFFDTFGTIHATTEGGPGGATKTLVYKIYSDGFIAQDLGLSAAESVVLMAITLALTAIQFGKLEKNVTYGK